MINILHIITALDSGGTENTLYKLTSRMDESKFTNSVISLTEVGAIGEKMRDSGIDVISLGMSRKFPNPVKLIQLRNLLKNRKPDVIQTWLYHADLLGGVAAKLSGGSPVVWGIRSGAITRKDFQKGTIAIFNICSLFSRWIPDKIVCCSKASQMVHEEHGYFPKKMVVIPNGFDLDEFVPDADARMSLREELELAPESIVIGLVGRFDRCKDHPGFFKAAAKLHESRPDVHFVLCGDEMNTGNSELVAMMKSQSHRSKFHLLGRRSDIPRVTAAFDIAVSSSSTEGFPNVIGEAMACGIPCAVTDAGESAQIVGDTGKVVPIGTPGALAAAWLDLLEMGSEKRIEMGLAARRRVQENFDLHHVIEKYQDLYSEMNANTRN
jgi:glycosyltransferase involved in cell wall biosynthesis